MCGLGVRQDPLMDLKEPSPHPYEVQSRGAALKNFPRAIELENGHAYAPRIPFILSSWYFQVKHSNLRATE